LIKVREVKLLRNIRNNYNQLKHKTTYQIETIDELKVYKDQK